MSGKGKFFQLREISGNFLYGQGNLERTWKVREKSGNLKINGYGRLSSGKDVLSHEIVSAHLLHWGPPSPSSLGATLKGKNFL